MNLRLLLAVPAAAVVLALPACSDGGSAPAGGTSSSAGVPPSSGGSESSGGAAEGEGPSVASGGPTSSGGGYVDPAEAMPRFADAPALVATPALKGYWADDVGEGGCNPVEKGQDRDPMTDDRVSFTAQACWVEGTDEQVNVKVYSGDADVARRTARAECEPETYGATCMPGNGWVLSVLDGEEPALAEVLSKLKVEVPQGVE